MTGPCPLSGEEITGEIGGDAHDRADGQIDVAAEYHQCLSGGEEGHDHHAGGDPVEEPSAQIALDEEGEHHHGQRDDSEEGRLLHPFRSKEPDCS